MTYSTFVNKMGHKSSTGIYWTILELKGLLEDEESCVCYEKHKKHIGMHPSHLRNVTSALREILNNKLNKYDSELKGILLAYKNPTLLSQYAGILYDHCHLHIDIEAEFYIFRPQVGFKLKGIVNKKGLNHIGVLVHKVFIVSIPQPEEEEDWPGNNVNIGQEIKFTINQVDFSSKLPYIRGVLYEDDYLEGCKLFNGDTVENNENNELPEIKNISINEDFISDPSGNSTRKRKRITFDSDSDEEEDQNQKPDISVNVNNSLSTENNLETEDVKPKLKKSDKKSKRSKKKIKLEGASDLEDEKCQIKSNISLSQEIENNAGMELQKSEVKKEKKSKKHKNRIKIESESVSEGERENFVETENEHSEMKKSDKKLKKSQKHIKTEIDSDEMDNVLTKIKTEPSDVSVKVKKESGKSVQNQEDSD